MRAWPIFAGLFLPVFAATPAMASDLAGESVLQIVSDSEMRNLADVLLLGDGNTLRIVQESDSGSLLPNRIAVAVSGERNGAPAGGLTPEPLIGGLDFGTLTQIGQGNAMTVSVSGSENLFAFAQSGANNSIVAAIEGNANMAAVQQMGANNIAVLSQIGNGNIVAITQRSW